MSDQAQQAWLAAVAQSLGAHAPWWFGAMLALLLAGTAAVWVSLPHATRRWAPRIGSALKPRAGATAMHGLLLAVCLAAGFAVIVGAAAVFAEMAESLEADEPLGVFDEALAAALRQRTAPGVLHAFAAVTRLGDVATLTVLAVVVALLLLWRRRPWLALGWSIALAGNGVLTRVLKSVFERVRPLHEHGVVVADGWSFPSGHSSSSVVAYGMLAYVLLRQLPARWHLPVVLAAVAVAFSVGCSRAVLQVHYASDVVAGFASGTAWLAVCVLSIEALRWHRTCVRPRA